MRMRCHMSSQRVLLLVVVSTMVGTRSVKAWSGSVSAVVNSGGVINRKQYHHSRMGDNSFSKLRSKQQDDDDDEKEDDASTSFEDGALEAIQDLETYFQQFEEQMYTHTAVGDIEANNEEFLQERETACAPPLFYTERVQEMECQLLQSLKDSDEAIDLLVELWRHEGGPMYAKVLQNMENYCSSGLHKEERRLRSMIKEFSFDSNQHFVWVEPMVRLALLLFTRGKYEEVSEWCQKALQNKPWHLEAAQLLLVTHLRLGQYSDAIQLARQKALPDLRLTTNNRRRKLWVERQIQQAEDRLEATRRAISANNSEEEQQRKSQLNEERYIHTEECPIDEVCWG